jgi:alkylation response protein AidB-like acyl-CoA dehydrogenase
MAEGKVQFDLAHRVRINIASCSLGGAQAAFEAALEHAKVRKQFGTSLSTNQVVLCQYDKIDLR